MAQTPGYGAYDQDVADIERRRQYAELLRNQAMQPIPQQMAGRVAIRTSPLEALAKGLQGFGAQKQIRDIGDERKALDTKIQGERSSEMESLVNALRGTPARPQVMGADDRAMIADQGGEAAPMIPGTPGDPNAAAAAALMSKFGDIRQMAPNLMNIAETRQNRTEDRAFREQQANQQREFQMAQLKQRSEDARLSQQERLAAQAQLAQMQIEGRKEIAAITAANRPEKMMTVMGPEGEPVSMPQSQAVGMTPYTPALAKAAKEAKGKEGAKQQLNDTVTQLRGYYDDLKQGGGIVSQDQGSLGNIASRVQSSGVGQYAGGALGTKNQEARQKIEQTRPLLLNLIKNATGMSAQQMNSNAEMQLYLRAATDPTLSYEANVEALNNLDKLFGLGVGVSGKGETPKRRATDKAASPVDALLEKYK